MEDTTYSKRIHPDWRYAIIDDELTWRNCSVYSQEWEYIEWQDQLYLEREWFIFQEQ